MELHFVRYVHVLRGIKFHLIFKNLNIFGTEHLQDGKNMGRGGGQEKTGLVGDKTSSELI
jgi:hypothetical protein